MYIYSVYRKGKSHRDRKLYEGNRAREAAANIAARIWAQVTMRTVSMTEGGSGTSGGECLVLNAVI